MAANPDPCKGCGEVHGPRDARCSQCPDPTTEDESRTPIVKGLRCFNYYDGEWGVVLDDPDDRGWFHHGPPGSHGTLLNGVRVSMYDPKERRETVCSCSSTRSTGTS
jgi:hypothetical protein